ncbi:MAG TPA: DUF2742 domain-containing protein [Mycobacterium sp.]|nr:DUF2742 domain-containing protein [Mycobacterium sp.]
MPPSEAPDDAHLASQQVSWAETHRFIETVVAKANAGPLPWAGSPAWCELSDGDPRKLLALAAAGEHHVLRVEVAQTARAEASRAVAAAADWPKIARENKQRNDFYAARPWLRRAAS